MLKILQARLQHYVNHVLPDVQAGFKKGRETRDQTFIIIHIKVSSMLEAGAKMGSQRNTEPKEK